MIRTTSIILYVALLVSVVTSQDPPSNIVTQITFRINEQLEEGTYVGNVAAESNLGLDTDVGFKMTTGSSTQTLLVKLNETTGELRTSQVIDREVECKNEVKCEREFQILAVKIVKPLTITLIIDDINDNTPTFTKTNEELPLRESLASGAFRLLPTAIDLDKGVNNGVEVYEFSPLSDNTDKFELVAENDDATGLSLKLKLVERLDRETVDHYKLYVLAKDNGVPKRTGTLTIDITVEDDNDNKPEFVNSVVNVTVTEDILVGKGIVTLSAVDIDAGNNGQIEYTLGQQQSSYILDHFAVNSTSGELSTRLQLKYEAGNSEKIIYIIATDKGDNPQLSRATVYLTIKDAGNNPPQISVTFLMDDLKVPEGTPIDTAVMFVTIIDSDTGSNGVVTCNMYNTYFGLQPVANAVQSFQVFVQHKLDRETIPEHKVTIVCHDGGGLETSANYTIIVQDENDHTPQFQSYVYYANITENNTIGVEVLRVHASDADEGLNGKISYKILASDEFRVEEDTGIVRAKISLDRELYNQKIFNVLAVDNNKDEPRTGTATVQVNIIDINDVMPTFTIPNPPYQFRVKEGMESNTYVDSVTAIDTDKDENGRVSYDMVPEYKTGAEKAVPFAVLPNGEVKTTMELDRESIAEYTFKVIAKDHGVPSLTSTVDVVVTVEDVNDEIPEFDFPSDSNNTVIAFNEVSDDPIATLTGSDADVGINQELIFFIAEGDENGIFFLDSNSGKLYIIKYVHLKVDTKFTLLVSVYDKGHPARSASSNLHVTLRYTNATTAEPYSDVNKGYVIIVVTVVCVTCLLSVTIITIICLIRRQDLSKCGKNNETSSKFRIPSSIHSRFSGNRGNKPATTQQLANDKIYPTESLQQRNQKKEVSFSLEDGDSLTCNDFKPLTAKDKGLYPSRQTPLNDMPEEAGDQYDGQPNGILRSSQGPYSQGKFLDHAVEHEVQLNVSHQREDSHSETSGETTTSHDSGKGGSVEGDNHDVKFDMNPVNRSAYLIYNKRVLQAQAQSQSSKPAPAPHRSNIPPKTLPILELQPKQASTVPPATKDSYMNPHISQPHSNTGNPNVNQNRTRNWCHNIDSNGSYPDSDYLSLGSNHNQSQGHINSYRDADPAYNPYYSTSSKSAKYPSSPTGYSNSMYPTSYGTYRSNSTRDDDETTTTSGSYTINHEDVDDDLASPHYQVSQVV